MMLCMIHVWLAVLAACAAGSALADEAAGIVLLSHSDVPVVRRADAKPAPALLHLTAVLIEGTGWDETTLLDSIGDGLRILAQCGVGADRITLMRIAAPRQFHDLSARHSRVLAAAVAARRPTLFFVRDTRNRPAFDAEAFGTGNTRLRPELEHSVWITRNAPDLPETVAHELFHVLANSGGHAEDSRNLMHDNTAPGRHMLTPQQCANMLAHGQKAGLLAIQ